MTDADARAVGAEARKLIRYARLNIRAAQTMRAMNRDATPISEAVRLVNAESEAISIEAALTARDTYRAYLRFWRAREGFMAGWAA